MATDMSMTREALDLLKARLDVDVLEGQVFAEEQGGDTTPAARHLIGMINLASVLLLRLAESTGNSRESWLLELSDWLDGQESR
jgi:hypothetical protein